MKKHDLTTFALDIGELMLISGAETYRVEDTILRILASSQGMDLQSFVTPTGIFVSYTNADGLVHSNMRRVDNRHIHLSKIDAANDLSRRFCDRRLDLDEAVQQLELIKKDAGYSNTIMIVSTSLAASIFAFVLGGTVNDALVTLSAGMVLALFQSLLKGKAISKFFIDLIGGFLTTTTALAVLKITNIQAHQNIILISAVMPLVPGVAITNAIRDTLHGHLVSGNARILDAFIVAASIASGVGIALSLFNMTFGGVL